MKFGIEGNAKLGTNCVTVSRPVGETCPKSCEFLGNGCYAEILEKRYPNVRESSTKNLITESGKIRSMLLYAHNSGKSVRLHVSGDFSKNGRLDEKYLYNWIKAISGIEPHRRPKVWFYTHLYSSKLLELQKFGVSVYASVSSKAQLAKARKSGFKLFAWADIKQEISKRTQHGKPHSKLPNYMKINNRKYLVCPEQRLGRKRVTCTGSCDIEGKTTACNYCVSGKGNVLFLLH